MVKKMSHDEDLFVNTNKKDCQHYDFDTNIFNNEYQESQKSRVPNKYKKQGVLILVLVQK